MPSIKFIIAGVLAVAADPVFADGNIAAGEKTFRKCKACHMIADGDDLIVRGGKIGPNLFGIVGATAGVVPDFRYGKSIVEAGEAGLVWNEANLAAYLLNPTSFLKETLGKNNAKSSMNYRLAKGDEDVAAYLASLAPVNADVDGEDTTESQESE